MMWQIGKFDRRRKMLVPNGKLQATLLREGGMIAWRHDILDNDT
jgi:hypothetical protein